MNNALNATPGVGIGMPKAVFSHFGVYHTLGLVMPIEKQSLPLLCRHAAYAVT